MLRNAIEEWQESHALHLRMADIEMEGRPFAAGSFKNVYRGSLRITVRGGASKRVMVAVLKMRRGDCAMEARMLLKIGRHPRVVRFLGQCVDGEDQLLVTEFAPLGSLADAFETLGNKFTLAHSVVIMQQIAQAMEHLASEGIIHRDLAARNVLVFAFDENNVPTTSVKLSDYGMSVGRYNRSHVSLASGDKPIRYMPPEALQRDRFSEKSDVWAFGVVCWEILTLGVIPYFEILEERVILHVCDGGRLQLVGDSQLVAACPDALWSLIKSCWCTSTEDRPGFSGVVTTLGSMSAQMAQHRAVRAEALLAEERLEREKLARDKTDLEAQLARVNLQKRQEEEKAVRAEALLAEERLEREKLAQEKSELRFELARVKLEKRQADNALQEAQDARVARARVCLRCEMNGDESKKDEDAGIECLEGHFHCESCVTSLVQDLIKVENKGKHARLKGEVKCFQCPTPCNAPSFTDQDLARHLSAHDFQAYLKAKVEILEADLKAKVVEEHRKHFEEEIARLKALDERERKVLLARKHIEEEILQPKCPRHSCRRAFIDFADGFALTCNFCTCNFCAWCMQDCGNCCSDACRHVIACSKVPRGVNALYPQMPTFQAAFEKTHMERCRERIKSYLDKDLDPDIRDQVRQHVLKIAPALSYCVCSAI